jgi:hypothetical protein
MNNQKSTRIQSNKSTDVSNLALRHIENRIEILTKLVIRYIYQIAELQMILARERDLIVSTSKTQVSKHQLKKLKYLRNIR